MMMMEKLFCPLLGSLSFTSTARSGKFTLIVFKKFFSQVITADGIALMQNPIARFDASKLNISPADIERMFKSFPGLQKLKYLEKVEQFVCVLESNGCKPDQIAKIIMGSPKIVTIGVEKMQPKLQLLKESGIEGPNLARVLTCKPQLLATSLNRELLPKIKLLKTTFVSHDLFIKAVVRTPSILTYNLEKAMKPSLAFFEGHGLRGMELATFLYSRLSLLRISSFTPAQIELIGKTGVPKESRMYKYILDVVATYRLESLESKMHNLQLCGLSSEETMELFRNSPLVLHYSTDKVRQTMQFLINDVGLPANSVVKRPHLLGKNLEKVIKPRFLVLQEIKSLNGLGNFDAKQFSSIITMPEAKFLSKIVEGHPQSTTLYGVYEKAISNVSSCTKIARKINFY
ncbi:hypothetical protein SUGI_0667620 [Cryptomeria japonica]|uniref:transcription termination factor MTERF5, chloroplastic n=1 Tax=Cryptomeria japonica TaxID=3369 RepID=UPI00241474DD|nr:transcription termination factor MTERF5, chloroplastic [Cryptomeria japonica]XP_057817728.2 transcription termination factor MTERF5, chloroplastic [Cryptomeria japonica]XP_057817729.2 transcription termination factor MTERF5, chloroplastic [Cryptomeria japonica]GLJ33163.1 hypothetical protein SUGI_0667620 [Cryptomeria japonica]